MSFSHPDVELFYQVDLSRYTTLKLLSAGDLALVKSLAGLENLLKYLKKEKRDFISLGWGANQVFDEKLSAFLIKMDFPFPTGELDSYKKAYQLPASIGLNKLTALAIKYNIKGFEVFTGVPASLGGAIAMNAGTALGEIGQLVESVEVMNDEGELRKIEVSEKSFTYRGNNFLNRGDIIVSARLKNFGQDPNVAKRIKEYILYRKQTQPLEGRNCGCVFKNPAVNLGAGKVIDLVGLKGFGVGDIAISAVHANFFNNHSQARKEDFLHLVENVRQLVELNLGIRFELEAKV